MTTITFQEDIKMDRLQFKNVQDFVVYLQKNYYPLGIFPLPEDEIIPEIKIELEETKKLYKTDKSEFVDI